MTSIINGSISTSGSHAPGDDVKTCEPFNDKYNKYTDYANGYSLLYPKSMIIDVSLSAIRTVFSDEITQIEIYYDNFAGSLTNTNDYIHYGKRFGENNKDHVVETDQMIRVNGQTVHLMKWMRRKLARLPGDKNYYACAEVVKNDQEVYTIFIKSQERIANEMDIIRNFLPVEKRGTAHIYKPPGVSRTHMSKQTTEFYRKYFSSFSPLQWGIYETDAPDKMEYVLTLENKLGYTFPFLLRYQSLDETFPARALHNAKKNKRYVELTLQTLFYGKETPGIVYEVLDGKYDDFFTDYAKGLKAYNYPVLFRFNNEMNGDWCWYSSYHTGKDTDLYKAMWRYIHRLFEINGVDNVLWVWNPHDLSFPNFAWNHHLMYYPGDEYVDIIGITGYNTGTYFPGENWREFDQIYAPLYAEYTKLFSQPLMITEFASSSVGGDKVAWIHRMFNQIGRYDRIKVAIWWSNADYDKEGNPGRLYWLNETEATFQAFREHLPRFQHSIK